MAGQTTQSTVPSSLLFLCIGSFFFGLLIHLTALRGPYHELTSFFALDPYSLRVRALGAKLVKSTGRLDAFTASYFGLDPLSSSGRAFNEVARFFFVLLALFQHFLGSQLGKGLLLGIAGHVFPIATFMMVEPMKPTRNTTRGILVGVAVLLLGQGMCVGAAMPMFWIPYYAIGRIVEAKSLPQGIYPLSAPARGKIGFLAILNVIVAASVIACAFVPNISDHFIYANLYFQFFPLFYLPLIFASAFLGGPASTRTGADGTDPQSARNSAALGYSYAAVTLASAVMQRLGAHYAWDSIPKVQVALETFGSSLRAPGALAALAHPHGPQRLLQMAQSAAKPALSNDGEWLLLIDMLGVLGTAFMIVLIDRIVDDWILDGGGLAAGTAAGKTKEARTKKRVERLHPTSSLAQQIFIGLPLVIALGPGVTLGLYLLKRERRAEAARQKTAKSL